MNDTHDNPTTGEPYIGLGYDGTDLPNPNPTTGEWTVNVIEGMHRAAGSDEEFYSDIANAHYAALAAMWAKWQMAEKAFDEQRDQLAAERELLGQQIEATTAARLRASEAEQQLAAEREKRVTAHCPFCQGTFVVEAMHVLEIQQLREKVQTFERTLEAAYERWRIIVKRAHADYTRELNAKLAQINAQSKTIRELVEALKFFASVIKSGESWSATCQKSYDAALGTYPLPDGRTK